MLLLLTKYENLNLTMMRYRMVAMIKQDRIKPTIKSTSPYGKSFFFSFLLLFLLRIKTEVFNKEVIYLSFHSIAIVKVINVLWSWLLFTAFIFVSFVFYRCFDYSIPINRFKTFCSHLIWINNFCLKICIMILQRICYTFNKFIVWTLK